MEKVSEEPPRGNDAELLAAARAGDRAALEHLLDQYQARVYGLGMRFCGNPEDAKDVLQETLLAAARNIRDFRGASSFGTWLFSIARRFCLKKRRRGRSVAGESAGAMLDFVSPVDGPEAQYANRQIGTLLGRAIANLTPALREVVVLRDIEGLSANEVAAVLKVSVDAVKSRLHRARTSVRQELAALGAFDSAPEAGGCPDVLKVFSRHLEGEISAEVCSRMESHVAACRRCRKICDSLEETLHACRSAADEPVPAPVQRQVRLALRQLLA